MKKIGVVLSGCGVRDGSEIHEAVFTLLAIDRHGAEAFCMAPDADFPETLVQARSGRLKRRALSNVPLKWVKRRLRFATILENTSGTVSFLSNAGKGLPPQHTTNALRASRWVLFWSNVSRSFSSGDSCFTSVCGVILSGEGMFAI